MIIVIQLIVITVAVGIVGLIFVGGQTHTARAWKKLAVCMLALTMAIAVLFPNVTNVVAHVVGVGRGADLLLYILTLTFIGYVVNNYIRQQRDKEDLHKLARKLALYEADRRIKREKN